LWAKDDNKRFVVFFGFRCIYWGSFVTKTCSTIS